MKIYQGRLPLYHFDAYRLEGTHQELGFEEMIDGEGLTVIEWPEYMEDLDQTQPLRITLHRLARTAVRLSWKRTTKSMSNCGGIEMITLCMDTSSKF